MKKRIACLMLALVMLIGLIPTAAVSASADGLSVSEAGIRVIKNYMGFQKNAYETYSNSGVYKIGYGTPSVKGATITEANADKLLREELAKLEGTVNAHFSNLVQKRVDALIWYSYVEGTGWTNSSVFKSAIQNNASASALADAMCTWDYDASGFPDDAYARTVITRRMAMANLYLNGGYSATATGSLGYTVFYAGDDAGASFPNGAKKMVQVYSGSSNKIKISAASEPTLTGAKFLGWYTGNTLVTGVGASTAGQVLTAHWQKSDAQVSASYTLPAYVIYEAQDVADNETVIVYDSPATLKKIDVVERESTVTVVAEKIVGSEKWIQLSTGGWVKLCSSISNMPTILPATTVTITDDYVNIRKDPAATSTKLGTLKRGEKVTIVMVSSDGNWGYCSKGWIFLAYTSYDSTSGSAGTTLTGGTTGYVTGAPKVNVRSGAGVGNALVTQLAEGTAITVYEQTKVGTASWGHIDQGWISMDYVKLNETTQTGSNITTGSSAVVSSSVSLNVRSGPGTSYSKVATLAPGTSVVILRKETVGGVAWGLIDQGWINLNYVKTTASSNGGSGYGVGGTVVNCSTGVNIRSAAGTTNALVGVAALGSRVTVTERVMVNGFYWGHIDRGWVCMDYIQLDSEFVDPSTEVSDELDNVVNSFQGYPAVTKVSTNLLDNSSVHANVILTLNANVEVNILARAASGSNVYGKVAVGNKTGWINLKDVTLSQVNAKVTATKADAYEMPSIRSQFYASLDKGTYVTVGNADGTGWELSDGVLWGQVSIAGHSAWIKMADVTMFKENTLPTGITTLSGVGYLTGTLTGEAIVYKDENGNVSDEASAYTLPAGSSVNVQARNYVSDSETWAKVTVGSVNGWIDWNLITLDPVTYEVATTHTTLWGTSLVQGQRITVIQRQLGDYSKVEINHGLVDVGYGYIGDDMSNMVMVVMDDGKLKPITDATKNDASNPAVSASVVVTGTASGNLKVYEEAIEGSSSLLTIQSGTNVTVLNWMNVDGVTWGKVQVNKIVGWIKTDELSFDGLMGKVKSDSLKVYSYMDKSWPVQVLRSNTAAFQLYDVEFDGTTLWAWIQVGNTIGCVDLSEVTLSTPGMEKDTSYMTTIAKGKVNGVNATVNVTDGSVLTLPKGTEVELAEIDMAKNHGTAKWKIKLGTDAGWIDMSYLTMYNSIATVTEASAPIYYDLALKEEDILYTLYRGEKATVLSYMVGPDDGKLYGEVAYGNTTGWILLCDDTNKMYVSLVPGSTGTTIGGNTTGGNTSDNTATTPTEPTTPATTDAYIVCSTTVNVRSGAGVDKPLVTTLANGTNVKIYEQTTVNNVAWARIDQGWVCMDYVRIGTLVNVPAGGNTGNTGSTTVAIVTTVPSGAIAIGYANQDIKVRSGSGMGYAEVATVKKNANVVLYEIKLDGGMSWGRTDNGWVCVSYLTITGIGAAGSGTTGNISGVGFTANVRGTANSNGALMAKVMITSPVVVRETTTVGAETWVRTDLGWILSQYVSGYATDTTTGGTATDATTAPTTPTDPTASGDEMDFVG